MAPLVLDESLSHIDDSCNDSISPKTISPQDAALRPSSAAAAESKNARADLKSRDPFLYYSNDEVRMATLKGQDAKAATANAESSGPCERKTRLSFELDPLLILGDELFEDCEMDLDLSNYIQELERSDDRGANLLAELLRI